MTGAIAHDDAERLRTAIVEVLDGEGEKSADPALNLLLHAVDVLESNGAAIVLASGTLLSTQEVADLLGVSRMTVVRLIDRGELEAEGGGVHRKVSVDEVARYRTAAAARRRAALRELAQDLPEDLPADQVISTR